MNKINEISKRYLSDIEVVKKTDFDARYGEHYNSVMLPHLKQLDETFNASVNELKQRLEFEKTEYVASQKQFIENQINSEYDAFFAAIKPFVGEA